MAVDIHKSAFVQTLCSHVARVFEDVFPRNGDALDWTVQKRPLTPAEDYVRRCLVSSGELTTTCDQLKYAVAYLSGYRERKTLDGDVITRADYLAYQLENFVIRICVIPDRALKLVNQVFMLGIPPKDCRFRVVAHNDHVARTPVRDRLKDLDNAVQPYRELRNILVHHERYSDESLTKLEGYFLLQSSGGEPYDGVVSRYRNLFKTLADRYVDSRRAELVAVVAELVERVAALFHVLTRTSRNHTGFNIT